MLSYGATIKVGSLPSRVPNIAFKPFASLTWTR